MRGEQKLDAISDCFLSYIRLIALLTLGVRSNSGSFFLGEKVVTTDFGRVKRWTRT